MERADNSVGRVEKRRLEGLRKNRRTKRGGKMEKKERRRGRDDKKRTRGKMQRGKTPEESGGTFPPLLSVTHFSFAQLSSSLLRPSNSPSYPSARPTAALFMTLSTSLAAVFLRHYTWKNFAGKLDIEPRVHVVSRRETRMCILSGGCTVE